MRCARRRKKLCRRTLPTADETFKLARAGRPSQKLALPVESYGTLSRQQTEGIVKAAARRLKDKTLAAQAEMAGLNNGASEQVSDELMNVEKVGVAREVLRCNSSAQQLGTIAMQVDQLRTVREVTTTLGVVSNVGVSFREVLTAAVTVDDGVAASIEILIVVPLSQPCGIDPEGKYVPEVAVMTCAQVTGHFDLIDRSH